MSDIDVIVIGGGISGLSFGHYAAKAGLKALVLEKEAGAGGCIHSHRQDGFWFEMGAHTAYNSYGNLIGILEERHGLARLLARQKAPFRLWADGKIQPITKKVNIPQLLLNAPRIIGMKKAGKSVRDYFGRIVGKGNFEKVFSPVLSAVPSQRADDFPAEMLFKSRKRRKDVLRSFTMQGGLQSIADCIEGTPNLEIRPRSEVTAIEKSADGYAIKFGEQTVNAPRLAMALPPSAAAPLLQGIAPEVAAGLAKIRCNPVESIGVMVKKAALAIEPVAGIIPLENGFFSAVSRDVVPDPAWRAFAFHLKPGTDPDHGLATACQVLGVERSAVEKVVERRVVLPSPVVGHDQVVAEIERGLGSGSLYLTGNYFGGLAIEDCVSRSKLEAARLAKDAGKAA